MTSSESIPLSPQAPLRVRLPFTTPCLVSTFRARLSLPDARTVRGVRKVLIIQTLARQRQTMLPKSDVGNCPKQGTECSTRGQSGLWAVPQPCRPGLRDRHFPRAAEGGCATDGVSEEPYARRFSIPAHASYSTRSSRNGSFAKRLSPAPATKRARFAVVSVNITFSPPESRFSTTPFTLPA